jgi:hypothetical protein
MDMSELARLRHDEPMARHVSWRAGGRARTFFQPADVADLRAFMASLPAAGEILFVGLGSNLLVRDGGFDGTVIFTHHALTGIASTGPLEFRAGAGVPAPHLARHVAKHGGTGAEWMAGRPRHHRRRAGDERGLLRRRDLEPRALGGDDRSRGRAARAYRRGLRDRLSPRRGADSPRRVVRLRHVRLRARRREDLDGVDEAPALEARRLAAAEPAQRRQRVPQSAG